MKDILNTDDLYLLVDDFYKKLLFDKSISYIFTDVVKIKLEEHLPIYLLFGHKPSLILVVILII